MYIDIQLSLKSDRKEIKKKKEIYKKYIKKKRLKRERETNSELKDISVKIYKKNDRYARTLMLSTAKRETDIPV